ncbi:MAG: helix-turn-helix domain-containing protein [Oscillospiraceae bacterium]|nr:helix-turn-helix domain-containing protein [Oscillospiraceae bacterium]
MKYTTDITQYINTIRALCQVGICYYDLNNFFEYNQYGIRDNRGHYCEFCRKVRELPIGRKSCDLSDKTDAVRLAEQYKKPFFFECHIGMQELIVPIFKGSMLLGILFVGQCATESTDHQVIVSRANSLGGDGEKMLQLFQQLPFKAKDDLLNIGKLLSAYFETMIYSRELMFSNVSISDLTSGTAQKMKDYIDSNYTYSISPGKVAKVFFINPSYASRCFHQHTGISMSEYINSVRIEKAKYFLSGTSIPIGNIALNVGFSNCNYFSRVFKKAVGITPTAFRKSAISNAL